MWAIVLFLETPIVARILVVDDDEQVRTVMRQMLEVGEHQVTEAEDGRMGVEFCRKTRFDLVLLDIIMPKQEGLESIRQLRAIDPKIRIIAVSGGGRGLGHGMEYLNMAKAFGAVATVEKPVGVRDLLATVDAALASEVGDSGSEL